MRKKLLFTLFSIFIILSINSCKDNPVPVQEDDNFSIILPNPNISENSIDFTDASVDADYQLSNSVNNEQLVEIRIPLENILRQLRLNSDQVSYIRQFARDYFDCMQRANALFKATEEAIINRAKEARNEVLRKLQAGEITREQAERQITYINKAAREALKNNPAKERFRQATKDCMHAYINKIKRILNDVQLERFNQLLRRLSQIND